MAIGSIATNSPAMIALQSLNITQSMLAATEKQISTGYRVADAVDDGAAYAVAQGVRSDVASLTSANQQLGTAAGILSTTTTALNNVSNTMINAKAILVKLSDTNVAGTERSQYQTQYNVSMRQLRTFFYDAVYNGKTLIGNIQNQTAATGTINVIQDERGNRYTISSFSGTSFFAAGSSAVLSSSGSITSTLAALYLGTAGSTNAGLGSACTFANLFNKISTELNYYGFATDYVSTQVSYNSNKIDALNTGLGALIDANLTQESAQLQSLQVRQQLGTQALSIANQSPQSLLTLFK